MRTMETVCLGTSKEQFSNKWNYLKMEIPYIPNFPVPEPAQREAM